MDFVREINERHPIQERTVGLFPTYLRHAELMYDAHVRANLAPHQRDAVLSLLVDVVSNVCHANGPEFRESKFLHALNGGLNQIAAAQFMTFVYSGRRVDSRLWAKRNTEQLLFRRGYLTN